MENIIKILTEHIRLSAHYCCSPVKLPLIYIQKETMFEGTKPSMGKDI